MNLRFEKDSMRIRLGQEEFKDLDTHGSLHCEFAVTPAVHLKLQIRRVPGSKYAIQFKDFHISVEVPEEAIIKLGAGIDAGNKSQLSSEASVPPVTLLLEVDYFEVRRPGARETKRLSGR